MENNETADRSGLARPPCSAIPCPTDDIDSPSMESAETLYRIETGKEATEWRNGDWHNLNEYVEWLESKVEIYCQPNAQGELRREEKP